MDEKQKILKMVEDGKITEEGNHASLLRNQKHYFNLYTSQFRKERTEVIGLLT